MKKNRLAICDSEQEYAYRLMDALSREADFPFEISTFTSVQKLYESLRQQPVQILLVAGSDYSDEMQGLAERVILLWEGEEGSRMELPGISKYCGIVRILKKITETAKEAGSIGPLSKTDHPVHFLGFYTPVGRCLQTTLAFATGQVLARSHKVLYLNFERFSGLESALSGSFGADLGDLLYDLHKPPEEVLERLYRMVEPCKGLDVILPAYAAEDILCVEAGEWQRFFSILNGSRYAYVILDLTDCVQGIFGILEQCSRVYTVVRREASEAAKIARFEAVMRQAGHETVLQKTRKCVLPVFARLPGDYSRLPGCELTQYAERMLLEDEQGGI